MNSTLRQYKNTLRQYKNESTNKIQFHLCKSLLLFSNISSMPVVCFRNNFTSFKSDKRVVMISTFSSATGRIRDGASSFEEPSQTLVQTFGDEGRSVYPYE